MAVCIEYEGGYYERLLSVVLGGEETEVLENVREDVFLFSVGMWSIVLKQKLFRLGRGGLLYFGEMLDTRDRQNICVI